MGSDRIRLGVIGVGNIARLNVQGYLDHPNCDVVALCDATIERAEGLAKEWGVPDVYDRVEDLLSDESIDAVEILTPTYLHHQHVMAALAAGKHVSVQKPIANTVEDAREMERPRPIDAGLTLRVSECYTHYPPLEQAKALIREGAIGTPTAIRIKTVVGQTDSAFQAGLEAGATSGGSTPKAPAATCSMTWSTSTPWPCGWSTRTLSTCRRRPATRLLLRALRRHLRVRRPGPAGDDGGFATAKMWMRSSYFGADEFFEVQGDEGFVWVTRCTGEMLDLAPLMLYRGDQAGPSMTEYEDTETDWGSGFRRSSAHFIDALRNGTQPDMSAGDAIKVLQLCFAVYQAGNTNSRVDPRTITGSVTPTGWAEW